MGLRGEDGPGSIASSPGRRRADFCGNRNPAGNDVAAYAWGTPPPPASPWVPVMLGKRGRDVTNCSLPEGPQEAEMEELPCLEGVARGSVVQWLGCVRKQI